MTKTNRSALKDHFQPGSIPKAKHFEDLIDSMLIQGEDNIDQLPNGPLSVKPFGPEETLINFSSLEQPDKPGWQLKQKAGEKFGLSISEGTDSRLFIESGTGNVGIGVPKPATKLAVGGSLGIEGTSSELFFQDNGQIRSADDNHRILFRRSENTLELREYGEIVFSPGATQGQETARVTFAPSSAEVIGTAVIHDGTAGAVKGSHMASGSLTIGSTKASYGGGRQWNENTAGLMLETAKNTEIAVRDADTRVASLMCYEGEEKNRITIGRDMGWGAVGSIVLNGALSGTANDYMKAQFTLSGGGTVTWGGPGGRLKWTARFIAISMERPASFKEGHVNIIQPTTDIPSEYVYDGKPRSTTSDGVILNGWEALYAVHAPGADQTQVSFRIVRYTHEINAPSNWVLVAVVNQDDGTVKLGTGVTLSKNSSSSQSSPIPRGVIMMWSGQIDNLPGGWSLCDGNNGAPDLRDRFIVGAGKGYGVGNTGGQNTVQLALHHMPSHNHDANEYNLLVTKRPDGLYTAAAVDTTKGELDVLNGAAIRSAGGDQPHENRPPYYALAYIMKL